MWLFSFDFHSLKLLHELTLQTQHMLTTRVLLGDWSCMPRITWAVRWYNWSWEESSHLEAALTILLTFPQFFLKIFTYFMPQISNENIYTPFFKHFILFIIFKVSLNMPKWYCCLLCAKITSILSLHILLESPNSWLSHLSNTCSLPEFCLVTEAV